MREEVNLTTLNRRDFYRSVLRIALPIAVQSLIASSLSLVDNLMVGSLGETELAAVGAGIQIFVIHWMFLFGFCSGSSTFISQFYGNNDIKNIKKTIGFTAMVSTGIGAITFLCAMLFAKQIMSIYSTDTHVIELGVDYIRTAAPAFIFLGITQPLYVGLRATQQPQLPLYISLAVFATNTGLNYVFIFGKFGMPRLESTGAAVGTLIARALELTLVLIVVFGGKNLIGGKPKEYLGASRDLIKGILKNNIPTTANETFWGLGQSMYMAAIGHISVTAYAATQACQTINNVFTMAGFSLGDAALILIGQKLGQNDKKSATEMARKFIPLVLIVGGALGVLLLLFSGQLLKFFEFSAEGHNIAKRILIVYGCVIPLKMLLGMFVTGILRGGGDTTFAAACELLAVWLIGVPLAFIGAMVFHLPAYLVVLLTITPDVVELFVLYARYKSGKWAKNVISKIE